MYSSKQRYSQVYNMTQKTTKKKVYSEDQVVTILEDIRDQFTAFGEGLGIVSDKVDNLEHRFDKLEGRFDNKEGRFDNLEHRFDNLEGRFDKLEGRFDNLEGRFDALETKVDRMQEDVTDIKHELAHKVDIADFQKLEKRVVRMEKIVLVSYKNATT